MARGRKDRGLYDGRNVSGARMWLEVGATEDSMVGQCIRSKGVAGGRTEEDCMTDATCKEPVCGWR